MESAEIALSAVGTSVLYVWYWKELKDDVDATHCLLDIVNGTILPPVLRMEIRAHENVLGVELMTGRAVRWNVHGRVVNELVKELWGHLGSIHLVYDKRILLGVVVTPETCCFRWYNIVGTKLLCKLYRGACLAHARRTDEQKDRGLRCTRLCSDALVSLEGSVVLNHCREGIVITPETLHSASRIDLTFDL